MGDLSISQGTSATDARIISGSGNIQLRGEHIAVNDFSALTSGEIEVIAGQGVSSTGEIFSASAANNSYDLSAASFDLESKGAGIGESGGSTLEILSMVLQMLNQMVMFISLLLILPTHSKLDL